MKYQVVDSGVIRDAAVSPDMNRRRRMQELDIAIAESAEGWRFEAVLITIDNRPAAIDWAKRYIDYGRIGMWAVKGHSLLFLTASEFRDSFARVGTVTSLV